MVEMISSRGASISCSNDDDITLGRQMFATAMIIQFMGLYSPER